MKRCLLAKVVKTLIKSNLDSCRATITCRVKLIFHGETAERQCPNIRQYKYG